MRSRTFYRPVRECDYFFTINCRSLIFYIPKHFCHCELKQESKEYLDSKISVYYKANKFIKVNY